MGDNDMNSLPEDYPNVADAESEAIDYETYPRNNYRPNIGYDYHRYGENPFRPPYAKKVQPYFMASDQMESMAMKPMARPFMPNHIRQHPVYANLYWRKIVYPSTYPTYPTQNDNALIANTLGELQTQESNHMHKRHPNRRYKKRRRIPSARPLSPIMSAPHLAPHLAPQLAPLYPVPFQSIPMQPNMYYYKSPGYYPKRRRPVKPNYSPNYFYDSDLPY